jgi:hypothetical protein
MTIPAASRQTPNRWLAAGTGRALQAGMTNADCFFYAALETLYWSETVFLPEPGESPEMDAFRAKAEAAGLSEGESFEGCPLNLSAEDAAELREECDDFLAQVEEAGIDLTRRYEEAGHDFILTRNRHGAGFWDGDWEQGDELTDLAHGHSTIGLELSEEDGELCLVVHG